MNTQKEVLTPSQIFEAIAYAKSEGTSAFKLSKPRASQTSPVQYMSFEVNRLNAAGVRGWVPVSIKFYNLNTKSNVPAPDNEKRIAIPGVRLQVAPDSTFTTTKYGQDGKPVVIQEQFGAAVIAVADAYTRLVTLGIKKNEISNKNKAIAVPIQYERKLDSGGVESLRGGNEIIRMNIKFSNPDDKSAPRGKRMTERTISESAVPNITIYDARKKIPEDSPHFRRDRLNYEPMMITEDTPVTYGNIHHILPFGSVISGVLAMDTATISAMGIGLQANITMLIVKPSEGNVPNPLSVFDANELASFGEGQTIQMPSKAEVKDMEESMDGTEVDPDEFV